MKELLKNVLGIWQQYWGGSWYPWLLLLTAGYLLVFQRKKKAARQLLAFSGILLLLFAFPPSAWVLQKCVGAGVYWRVLWLLPTAPLLAYGATEAVSSLSKRPLLKWAAVGAVILAMAFGGKSVWRAGNYQKVNNNQKVPDEVAQICQLANSQKEEGQTLYLAANDYLAAYIRVYDPTIRMPYSRAGNGSEAWYYKALYRQMDSPQPRVPKIIKIARKLELNCLVHTRFTKKQEARLKKYGFELVGMVNDQAVYFKKGETT